MPRKDILKESEPRNTLLPQHEKLLDPAYVELYNKHIVGTTLEHQVDLSTYRSGPTKYTSKFPSNPIKRDIEIGLEEDITIPVYNPAGNIKLKLYRPKDYKQRKTAVHVHLHGGGWVLGAAGQASDWCRLIVETTGCTVVDLDYRLAPEFKYPVALTDS